MTYTKHDMKEAIIRKLRLNYGCTEQQASDGEMLKACAMVLRDIMAEHGVESREKAAREGARRVHYLSLEFLTRTIARGHSPVWYEPYHR